MKPILIDAIFINTGGALTVLNRLIDSAIKYNLNFVLLKDERCPKLNSQDDIKHLIILPPSLKTRHNFYASHKQDFYSVLCMSNVPPTLRLSCKVHTYFHNLSVLQTPATYNNIFKFRFWLKKQMIKLCKNNTDTWIVQTTNTQNILKKTLKVNNPIYVYPIYNTPIFLDKNNEIERKDYLFVGDFTYSKGHYILLEAWKKLHSLGKDYTLHLTVTRKAGTEEFCEQMDDAIKNNVQIINHGFVSFSDVCQLYSRCKAVVYPSLIESLGLGLVEGISAGCDVITANLPYAHSICKPSETFNPTDSDSIVNAILRYEEGNSPKSELTIHDCVNELLNLIYSKL